MPQRFVQYKSYLSVCQGYKKLLENLSKYNDSSFRERLAGHLLTKTWDLAEAIVPVLFGIVSNRIRDKKLSSFLRLLKDGQLVELAKVNVKNQIKFIQDNELGEVGEVFLLFELDKGGDFGFSVEGQSFKQSKKIKLIVGIGNRFSGKDMNKMRDEVLSVLIHELTHFWNTDNQKHSIVAPQIIKQEGKSLEEDNIISYLLADSEIEAFTSQILYASETTKEQLENVVFKFITEYFSPMFNYWLGRDPSEEIIKKIYDSLSAFIEKHFPLEEEKSSNFQRMLKNVHPGDKKDLIGRGGNVFTNDGEKIYKNFQRGKSSPPLGESIDKDLKYLKEVFQYELKSFKPKYSLCPHVWDENGQLLASVEQILNEIVKKFLKDERKIKNYDILVVGSLASYIWTEKSELDVVILFDFFGQKDDFLKTKRKFREKTLDWESENEIFVGEHRITLNVCHIYDYMDGGIFSLLQKKWLNAPIQYKPSFDNSQISRKVENFVMNLNKLQKLSKEDHKKAKKLIKIMKKTAKAYKDSALEGECGEFTIENSVYKILKKNKFVRELLNYEKQI